MQATDSKEKKDLGGGPEARGKLRASVDPEGRIVLPPEIASHYGLRPGSDIFIEEATNGLRLGLPVNHLAKVYIEPTNRCNLECRTCMRNEWSEPLGQMDRGTFGHILESLRVFSPLPKVFLGGLGEPLAHPEIVEMVAEVKKLGAAVELITNGTLLTREMSRKLIETGLDMALDIPGWGHCGKLRGCPPGGGVAPSHCQPRRVSGNSLWVPAQAPDGDCLCGHEAKHCRSARHSQSRQPAGGSAFPGHQCSAVHH